MKLRCPPFLDLDAHFFAFDPFFFFFFLLAHAFLPRLLPFGDFAAAWLCTRPHTDALGFFGYFFPFLAGMFKGFFLLYTATKNFFVGHPTPESTMIGGDTDGVVNPLPCS